MALTKGLSRAFARHGKLEREGTRPSSGIQREWTFVAAVRKCPVLVDRGLTVSTRYDALTAYLFLMGGRGGAGGAGGAGVGIQYHVGHPLTS